MVTGRYQENWKAQLVRLWYAKKVKDIALGTRMARGVINRRQLMSIAAGIVRGNNPNLLKEYEVIQQLLMNGVLEKRTQSKRKGNTGKIYPSPHFVAKEKFTFQRNISALVSQHDIHLYLTINIDQNPVICQFREIHFQLQGAKKIPIKGLDDKRQITVTFAGEFLPERSLAKYSLSLSFSPKFTENHWSNTERSVEFFK